MSRVGRAPIEIPSGVEVLKEGNMVTVKGPKGTISRGLSPQIEVSIEGGKVIVKRPSDERNHRSLHGLTRSLLFNMIRGVTEGFEKVLEIQGVGYKAQKKGEALEVWLGHSHPVTIPPQEGIQMEVASPTKVVIKGIDKEKVGEMAARLRALRKVEPYKGKGIRYQGEYVKRKAGKTVTK